jgi:hypothetical protein
VSEDQLMSDRLRTTIAALVLLALGFGAGLGVSYLTRTTQSRALPNPAPLGGELKPTSTYLDVCLDEIVRDPIIRGNFDSDDLADLVLVSDAHTAWPAGYVPKPIPKYTTHTFDWRSDQLPFPARRALVISLGFVDHEDDRLWVTLSVNRRAEDDAIGTTGSIVRFDFKRIDGSWVLQEVEHRK